MIKLFKILQKMIMGLYGYALMLDYIHINQKKKSFRSLMIHKI